VEEDEEEDVEEDEEEDVEEDEGRHVHASKSSFSSQENIGSRGKRKFNR
jgi:hypothetical protein